MTENKKERAKIVLAKLKKAGVTIDDLCYLLDCGSDAIKEGTVVETKNSTDDEEKAIFEEITDFLRDIGMPPHIKGFPYMRYAVELAVQDFTITDAIVKKLYPAVAEEFDTTKERVERAMRHAIELTWNRGNVDEYEKLFGKSMNPEKEKPTNSEFITTLADYIRVKHGKI